MIWLRKANFREVKHYTEKAQQGRRKGVTGGGLERRTDWMATPKLRKSGKSPLSIFDIVVAKTCRPPDSDKKLGSIFAMRNLIAAARFLVARLL
jgi:hypothetical protein